MNTSQRTKEFEGQQSAMPTEPELEDAYVWLMREQRKPHVPSRR